MLFYLTASQPLSAPLLEHGGETAEELGHSLAEEGGHQLLLLFLVLAAVDGHKLCG